jgi:hypothetical protein
VGCDAGHLVPLGGKVAFAGHALEGKAEPANAAGLGRIESGPFAEFFLRELFCLRGATNVQSESEEDSVAFWRE